ncbi:MAG: site-specific tyrosine recombinase XerD [Dehalococcoidia bacterium]
MDQYIQNFLIYITAIKGYSRNTVESYRSDLEQLRTQIVEESQVSYKPNELFWSRVDRELMTEYMASLKLREYSAATISRKIASLRSFFGFLIDEKLIDKDPTEGIHSPKKKRVLPKTLSVDDVQELLDKSQEKDAPDSLRNAAMLELMYATGMRVSELVGLNVHDINFEDSYILCVGKGSKERMVPVYPRALRVVSDYLNLARPKFALDKEKNAMFLNTRGKRLTRQGFWLILKKAAFDAGISQTLTPHSLRHSFASHLINGGAALRYVQELLGHSSISTTQIYTHLASDKLREEYEKAHPRSGAAS